VSSTLFASVAGVLRTCNELPASYMMSNFSGRRFWLCLVHPDSLRSFQAVLRSRALVNLWNSSRRVRKNTWIFSSISAQEKNKLFEAVVPFCAHWRRENELLKKGLKEKIKAFCGIKHMTKTIFFKEVYHWKTMRTCFVVSKSVSCSRVCNKKFFQSAFSHGTWRNVCIK